MKMIEMLAMAGQTPPGTEQDPRAGMIQMIGMFVVLGLLMYFMMFRPQQKQRKEQDNMMKNLKTGDKVLLSNGILGMIANVKEKTLMVKIADNVKIEVLKTSIGAVLQKADGDEATSKS